MYHGNGFWALHQYTINQDDIQYKMYEILEKTTSKNWTTCLDELQQVLFNELNKNWGKNYDDLYDEYQYYHTKILSLFLCSMNPSIVDKLSYRYNNIRKYLMKWK